MADYNVTVSLGGVAPSTGVYLVTAYGAVGDGVTDDTTAINLAISAANAAGGGEVILPRGDYAANQIAMKSNVWLRGYGATIVKAAGSLSDTNNAVNMIGTVTAVSSATSENVSPGESAIDVTTGASFAAGDWCLLRDNTWADTGVAGRNQEIVRVLSVAGNTVTLVSGAIGSYTTADSAEMVVITPVVNAHVSGLEIVVPTGTNTGGGVYADVSARCSVSECVVYGANDNPAIGFDRSCDVSITDNNIYDGQAITTSGYGYAIIIGEGSHNVMVSGNHQEKMRESACTTRARLVTVIGNSSRGCSDSHFNVHGAWCDGISIVGNTCSGGTYGYYVGFLTHRRADTNITISGNVVRGTTSSGISVNSPVGKESSNIVISGNIISEYGSVTSSSSGVAAGNASGVIISGNSIIGASSGVNSYGIQGTSGLTGSTISGNIVGSCTSGHGIALTTCTGVTVSSNYVYDVSSSNYRTINTNTGCRFIGNAADDATVSLTGVIQLNNSWQAPGSNVATAADGDTSPSVLGLTHLLIPANTGATAITQLDDGVAGQQVTLVCTSGTNPSTIADSGNFLLSVAWGPTVDDTITLFTANGTTWREIARSAN